MGVGLNHRLDRRELLRATASAVLASAFGGAATRTAANGPLRFGLTPVFLTNDLELLGRLQSYLLRATGYPVSLVTRRTYQEITALLTSGQLDAAWICGFPYVAHRAELQLVAVPLWHHKPLYQSYLIVDRDRKGSGILDLRGDIHAFSDPDSNSGFLVTRAALAERHLRPETFFAKTFFTYGHRNVIRAVASGLAGSGSVDGYVYEVVAELEPKVTAGTRILKASEWLGFPPIAAPRVPVDQMRLEALTKALWEMHKDDEGRAVLRMLRLDGFGAEDPASFDAIASKAALVTAAG
ncbi:PhnD/SsuA/transferrin family substrate-binding protein [Bradyrhizobium sp. AUGA SZCCT0283]|jgi:phosphonate transport system substrate-binding protein|uniref:substrate-binding domain-containing protein n=1 Tax=Bradyrhizobium sp. AUGA SZCCT0283 TaxID=2807671 RepID=UPI001BACFDEB|nr:PhnD/SsuA/transferrin family substrate-binding protein [Bradyrhizobium sp. AUGA SZCCT0283]MBR1276607.1 PhnD/SsuA/transferrin family substrate-binding protein [Bradyrhizobium sp. AUGA SZCCT0283]